jgi:predicted TIM-barrel fold metal-dependent hydrolase
MSDVIDRPILEQEKPANSRLRIIDCDVHPSLHARADLNPFLPKRWQEHMKTYGDHLRTPYIGTTPYPRSAPLISRRDAWPPTGGPPGSDLEFMQKQHLDPLDVEFGILQVLDLFIFSQQNLELGAAIQRAVNEWQVACWSSRDSRLKPSIRVGAGAGPADRHPFRRLRRPCADRRRLAVLLHRGAPIERAFDGRAVDQSGP